MAAPVNGSHAPAHSATAELSALPGAATAPSPRASGGTAITVTPRQIPPVATSASANGGSSTGSGDCGPSAVAGGPPLRTTTRWRDTAPAADGSGTILDVAAHAHHNGARLRLKPWVFVREWMAHLFLPFSLPVVLWSQGTFSLRNRHFWGCSPPGTSEFAIQLLQYVVQSSFWVMIVMSLLHMREVYDSGVIVDVTAVIILANYRNLLIGLKYAYLSRRVLADHARGARPSADMRADELLFGWLPLPTNVAKRKVDVACGRRGLDSAMPLVLELDSVSDERVRDDPLRELGVLFRDAFTACPELLPQCVRVPGTPACVRVPAKLVVLQAVLSQSTDFHHRPWLKTALHSWVNTIGGGLLAFLPIIIRSFSWGKGNGAGATVEWTPELWVIAISAVVFQFPIASQFLAPAMYAAFLDFYRRAVWLQFCGDIIAQGCVREVDFPSPNGFGASSPRSGLAGFVHTPSSPKSGGAVPPLPPARNIPAAFGFRLHLDVVENATNWIRTRQWLFDVGFDFHLRVRVYFSAIWLVLIVIAAALVVQLFTQLDARAVQNSPAYYALVLYTAAVLCVVFSAILYYGIVANGQAEKHITLVTNIKHDLQRHRLAVIQRQTHALLEQLRAAHAQPPAHAPTAHVTTAGSGGGASDEKSGGDHFIALPGSTIGGYNRLPASPQHPTASHAVSAFEFAAAAAHKPVLAPGGAPTGAAARYACSCAWLPTSLCAQHTPSASAGAAMQAALRGPGAVASASGAPSLEYHDHLTALLTSTVAILEAEDRTNFVGLAGFRVSDNFIRAVATVAASVVGIALRQIVLGTSSI